MKRVWLVLVGIGLILLAVLSTESGRRVLASRHVRPVPKPAATVGSDVAPMRKLPDDPPLEIAAPARGVTGTIALPTLPITAGPVSGEAGIVAARPFSLAGIGNIDRGRAVQCLTAAIYYEAASEPDAGQRAVAQVILNRVRHPAFPASVCGVVYQGSEHAGCQFSFACDGAMMRVPARAAWARAALAAGTALAGYVYAPVGLATHYHTYAVTPAWNRTLVMTDVVGAHFFHRWKGYWGTAAAFSQRYRGGEPVPGAHAAMVAPVKAADLIEAVVPLPAIVASQPMSQTAGPDAPPEPDNLPPESQVLDRWKDSGKPLIP